MSEFQFVEKEVQQIDQLLAQNYIFTNITEDLEGAYVTFMNEETKDEIILHIKMAESRKYFSSKLHEQLNK
ncbi:hypothetical protein LZ480_13435 [Solibacillus sp. MA9]|uniref:Uncharacterized protein n=1 Tax=Solibacillus palustris TaxID=2908203 RepID=A0ABS9UEW0_9BACL|nr:hypothetical protein [Solibacillus sp. MA9]MCH7322879.1 hypothetical protein [Solibacillus sp. MA9]